MEIHIQEMVSKGSRRSIRESLNADWLLEVRKDIIGVSPLEVDLTARGEEGIAYVEGELSIAVDIACSRCLDKTSERVVVPFAEKFKPAASRKQTNDEEVIIVNEEPLDMEPFFEETMLLSLPFAPLCSEDCKGLCHTCGTNLNEQNCGCTKDEIDPRLAALKDLFK
ncbi:DUF177 domain-containing protein [Paenibacillus oenotherae]|uniref:DUF177 domain-containing protein n=1 Tax=Paenibacillus oenotherae TaxID=1435645 RepID=A0ABS7D0G9_9BACL|nr:DUF177 domain-containing protein [Paenibacillus oenotherae]MBW7473341.1 DUF177 domain-containing protein [Paenibacillus oenotherae]